MTTPRDALTAALATLLDPENAPARHGAWHALHRTMGEHSVELVDDDGCSLWVEPWEIAVLVNDAVDRLAAPDPALLDAIARDIIEGTIGLVAPDPAPLDVERLARAMEAEWPDETPNETFDYVMGILRVRGDDIAREYARLATMEQP